MQARDGEKGYILLVLPLILGAIAVFSIQAAKRSKVAMRIAGSELDYFQTRLCAEQCASLAVNATSKVLESNGLVTPSTVACPCTGERPMDCRTTFQAPVQTNQANCYGLESARNDVEIAVSCKEDNKRSVQLNENVGFQEIPIFQFAVFFEGVLEILNGPVMNVRGKMHSNDSIKLFPDWNVTAGGGDLHMHDWVTSPVTIVGKPKGTGSRQKANLFFGRMDGSGADPNPIHMTNSKFIPLDELVGAGWDDWQKAHRVAYGAFVGSCGAVERLSVPLKSQETPHTLVEWRDPSRDDAETRRNKFSWRAKLMYKSNGWLEDDGAGGTRSVTLAINPVRFPTLPADNARLVRDATGARVRFWSARDQVWVRLLPVDVQALQVRGGDDIIYLHDEFSDAAQGGQDVGGFLLYNAKTLSRRLTIACNSRMYMWGDYNTTAGFNPGSGTLGPYPAALISDSYTQLSSTWDSRNFQVAEFCCVPAAAVPPTLITTLNTCIMSGMASVNGSWTNQGGYINLIRYMENWQAAVINFSGSAVAIWNSEKSPRAMPVAMNTIYNAPTRNWSFDPMYQKTANMPPATPRVVSPTLNQWELSRGR